MCLDRLPVAKTTILAHFHIYFISFFIHLFFDVPGPIFLKLCNTTRYVLSAIGCLILQSISYRGAHTCPLKFDWRKPPFCWFSDTKWTLWAPPFFIAVQIGNSKTIGSICGYVRKSIPNMVGSHHPTSEIGCSLGVWGGTGNFESI